MAKVEISPQHNEIVKQLAKEREITADQAAEYLIQVAAGRLSAIRRDAKRRAAGKPPAHRKVTVVSLDAKKEAAKPAKAKKTPKAKKEAKEASA